MRGSAPPTESAARQAGGRPAKRTARSRTPGGWRARIRTWDKGSKVPCDTASPLARVAAPRIMVGTNSPECQEHLSALGCRLSGEPGAVLRGDGEGCQDYQHLGLEILAI